MYCKHDKTFNLGTKVRNLPWIKARWSKSFIVREINVHLSTGCREIERNSDSNGRYVYLNAQKKCDARRHYLSDNHRKSPELWWCIEQMIVDEDWSPGQIAVVLRKEGIHIVKLTIYNHVHADVTGKQAQHMPHELKYRKIAKSLRQTKATNIADRTSIHLRPAEADGTRFGDWEMDTIVDPYGHAIVTLTERSTNFILMELLPQGRKAVPTARTVVRLIFPYRQSLKTITMDNGCEFAAHREITRALLLKNRDKVIVYFADSYASWQKGAIEHANKLIRKYIPKKANFGEFIDRKIMKIQKKLNRRPREKLDFDTLLNRFIQNII